MKETRPVIQRNLAAWIALYRTLMTHGTGYWTFNGRASSRLRSAAYCHSHTFFGDCSKEPDRFPAWPVTLQRNDAVVVCPKA